MLLFTSHYLPSQRIICTFIQVQIKYLNILAPGAWRVAVIRVFIWMKNVKTILNVFFDVFDVGRRKVTFI